MLSLPPSRGEGMKIEPDRRCLRPITGKSDSSLRYSGVLVFFGVIPAGAVIGALGGAGLFAMMALRDNEIAIRA